MKALTTLILSGALFVSGAAAADDDHRKKHHHNRHDTHEQKRYHGDNHRKPHHNRHHSYEQKRYYGDDQRHFKHNNNHGYAKHHGKYHGKWGNHGSRHAGTLQLDIPVRIHGEEKVGLRRLIRDRYGVNTEDYRLRAVVVNNYSHRRAAARLYTGGDASRTHYLYRGPNHIQAPHGDQYGRWILHVDDARVSNIRVVLEPRRSQWAHQYQPKPRRPWYYDRWSKWIRW